MYSFCPARRFTTQHRRNSQFEAPNDFYETPTVPGLVSLLLTFCTQLYAYRSTAEHKTAERSANTLRETSKSQITRPLISATTADHSSNVTLPEITGSHTLDTSTFDRQIGCLLLQQQPEGPDKTVGYWLNSLNNAEPSYDIPHKECFAVVWAVLLLRPYVEVARFSIQTDHDALHCIWDLQMHQEKPQSDHYVI